MCNFGYVFRPQLDQLLVTYVCISDKFPVSSITEIQIIIIIIII
jgi:hypothetical protein